VLYCTGEDTDVGRFKLRGGIVCHNAWSDCICSQRFGRDDAAWRQMACVIRLEFTAATTAIVKPAAHLPFLSVQNSRYSLSNALNQREPSHPVEDTSTNLIAHTADIVSAFVGQSAISADELPALIKSVYGALANIDAPAPAAPAKQSPAVPIKKSITPEFLISLEDGKKYKSLKRHLRTKYGMSPEDYRAKWGLPKEYPMVAPDYAASRSAFAKSLGLGRGGASKVPAKPAPKPRVARAPKA
jgi:predicted transcriptional regulator